jgi:predicted patatin/cPLA2 family phospholipase
MSARSSSVKLRILPNYCNDASANPMNLADTPSEWQLERPALVIEGGGLRGAFAVGVLRVLLERFGPQAFGGVYAVSSGVFGASFFIADQGKEMESTWRDLVCDTQLIDYWNVLRREPVLKLDRLVGLFQGPVLLNVDQIQHSPAELVFALTDRVTGAAAYFDAKRAEIFDLMRASSALPVVYPKAIMIDGQRYYDGGQSDAIPIRFVLKRGYRQAMVVRTRPQGYRKKQRSKWLANVIFRDAPAVAERWQNLHERYNPTLDFIDGKQSPPIQISSITPVRLDLGRLSRDRAGICAAIDHGKARATEYLEKHGGQLFAHPSTQTRTG